jgi:hypothetical protein
MTSERLIAGAWVMRRRVRTVAVARDSAVLLWRATHFYQRATSRKRMGQAAKRRYLLFVVWTI